MSQVKAIYARSKSGVMGSNNALPWSVPADMKRFRNLTSGCIVVMGFNTWLSMGCKPLPNRENVVIVDPARTLPDDVCLDHPNVRVTTSLDACMGMYRADPRTVWVIGGPLLIQQAMQQFDAEVHRTTLDIDVFGDVFSHAPDRELIDYMRLGYEEFTCYASGVRVAFERLAKVGLNAGLK